jgi:hypothetical protein
MRALLAVVVLAACTHARPISSIHELTGKRVTVETYSHQRIEVYVERAPDGVAFRAEDGGGYVPVAEVAKVVEKRVGRGGLEGLGIGALAGASFGAILGYAAGDDECNADDGHWCILTFTAGEKAVLSGILLGGLGGLLGGVVGLAHGSRDEYSYGEQVRVIPTGPPGSTVGMTVTF